MCPLDRLPCIQLRGSILSLLRWMPPDRGRIEEDGGACEGREPSTLRIPLIPADQSSYTPESSIEIEKARIARREVKLLEIQRVIGNVHLAIDPEHTAVGIDHCRGIVIQPRRAPFEQRRDHRYACLSGSAPDGFSGRTRNRLSKIEEFGILFTAKILRTEKFLQADDLRSFCCGFVNFLHGFRNIGIDVGGAGKLSNSDPESLIARRWHLLDFHLERFAILFFIMLKRLLGSLFAVACLISAAVPMPKEHFGFEPGDDYKLARYDQIIGYFKKLAAGSGRIRLVEYGRTSEGRVSYFALISSEENLKNVDRYREINRKLALGLAAREEAWKLSQEGKTFVWIDSGLHASEVAPAQHSPELAFRMVSGETDEIRRFRDKVILIQLPVINPDGLDMIAEWYSKNVGTPYELAPLPKLYQKYAGHDNNRDWYMMNLAETRNVSRLLFREWFPQIVYNQHQAPAFPARIFVPPYAEPLNPNIPAPVMEGINLIGSQIKERFARENKPGVLSYFGFDAWWNGGLRSVPAFHNMHGILTETALNAYATPRIYKSSEFPERFANGMPTREPTVFYQRPWMGGKWGTREAIEYMLTADFAILDLASSRSADFLFKAWQMAHDNIEAGKRGHPFAWVLPTEQWDQSSTVEMLRRLQMAGITVSKATSEFTVGGKTYPAGSWVLPAAQPFRGYLADLMEPQNYPELRAGTTGPTKRPYDVAGWTLPMQMGVNSVRVDEPFEAKLTTVPDLEPLPPSWDSRENSSFLSVAEALKSGEAVRWSEKGKLLRRSDAAFGDAAYELRTPKVALYEPWSPNMDFGWTQWLLDYYRVPYTLIHNEDFAKADLRSRFDTVLFASQSMSSILHGWRPGENLSRRSGSESASQQRPEYTGGVGLAGAAALQRFVQAGGTVVAFDNAAELPVQLLPLPLRSALRSSEGGESQSSGGYYCPGSILRITVDNSHPIAFGMPQETYAFQSGGEAWDVALLPDFNKGDRTVRTVARYASKNLLASGWLSGERVVAGKVILADARYGAGRVIVFGFRPQFRGQSFGTFKFVLNSLYLGSAKALTN